MFNQINLRKMTHENKINYMRIGCNIAGFNLKNKHHDLLKWSGVLPKYVLGSCPLPKSLLVYLFPAQS